MSSTVNQLLPKTNSHLHVQLITRRQALPSALTVVIVTVEIRGQDMIHVLTVERLGTHQLVLQIKK